MLPSKGYFSEIPCVFYLDEGCGRPCCHYRHSLQDVKKRRGDVQRRKDEVGAQSNSWSDDQINLVSKLVEKAVDKVIRKDPNKHLKIDKTKMVRETLNKLLLDNQAVKWALNKESLKDITAPSYEPTPIAKLNNQHIPVVCVPEKPISVTSQLKNFKVSTPAFSNSQIIGETSHYEIYTETPPNYADFSGTSLNFGVGLSISAKQLDDNRPIFDQGMECDDSNHMERYGDDSNHSQTVETSNFLSSDIDIQDSHHNTNNPSMKHQNHCSSSMTAFPTTTSKTNEASSSLHDLPTQSDVQSSTIYEEPQEEIVEPNSSFNFTGMDVLNTDLLCLGDYQHKNSSQKNKNTITTVKTSSKHNKNDSVKPNKLDSKFMECSNVGKTSLKKCLSLKRSKTKSNHRSEGSKLIENDEESATSKRSNSGLTREHFPNKKLKRSFSKNLYENSGSPTTREANQKPTTRVLVPKTSTIDLTDEGTHGEESRIDAKKEVRCYDYHKQVTMNTLRVASSEDPFTRWMKNKKIREILGKKKSLSKKKTLQHTNINTLKSDEKHNHQKNDTSNNTISHYENEDEHFEPLPIPKFIHRVAHKKDEVRPYPTVLDCIKIPIAYRQHFCDAFFQEFKKSMSVEEAKSQAVKKELEVANNSGVKSYKNNGSLQLMKLRKNGCCQDPEKSEDVKLEPSSCPDFTYGWSLYRCFLKYVMNGDEIRDNGYPLPIPGKPNCAFVEKSARKYSKEQPGKPSVRICANCSEEYRIGNDGVPVTKDDCFYHWGRLRKVRSMGQWMEKFTCCDGFGDSAPCESSTYHVWSGRNEDCMDDFVETPKLPSYMEECDAGIYALDCEMCYTTKGLELARLTVIDLNEDVVFDQVVSLDSPVLDYCTRFSGIDETKIRQATYTFDEVRAWVLENFFDKTILVGHSLENDLKALKLIHKTVIDTSVTFPHKFGPPNRMSLKHLATSLLNINIQEDEGGHDSKEDAATCLKLMMMKIKEDSKVRKPRIIIGYNGKRR